MVICNKCYNEHHDQCMGKLECLNASTSVLKNEIPMPKMPETSCDVMDEGNQSRVKMEFQE